MVRNIVAFAAIAGALFASSFAFAKSASPLPDVPPAGIVPTTMTLGAVLRLHTTAIGVLASGTSDTSHEVWHVNLAGVPATETLTRSGISYHSTIDRGTIRNEYGKRADDGWHLDYNGVVSPLQHEDYETFAMQRVLEDAIDPKYDVKLLGTTSVPAAYVVEIERPNYKHAEYFFYDIKTGYVVRTERIIDDEHIVSTYGDYRVTGGIARPWHVHDEENASGLAYDFVLADLHVGVPVDAKEFAPPTSVFRPGTVPVAAAMPVTMKDGTVILRLMVDGRGLDFELSSGTGHSSIDRGVALEMHLPTFEQPTVSKTGKPLAFDTMIADASIGDLHLHDFELRAIDFNYEPDNSTKIVGILGSDFMRSGIYTLDFEKSELDVKPVDGATFSADQALDLPVRFDDGIPFVHATIDGHETDAVMLDNDFPITTVLDSFVRRFPDAVPDKDGKAHKHGVLPFADSKQYGRESEFWFSSVPSFAFGQLSLHKYSVLATNADFSDDPIDAIVGLGLLQFFDVQFDFAHDRVLLRKNALFDRNFRPVPKK